MYQLYGIVRGHEQFAGDFDSAAEAYQFAVLNYAAFVIYRNSAVVYRREIGV